MKVIGLTGNIGTGKSTAAKVMKSLGIKLIDCDIVSREVVKDKKVLNILKREFGSEIIKSDGTLDRKKLGEKVFSNKENLAKLNNIIHPLIKKRVKEYINEFSKCEKICIVDGAIIIEAGFQDILDDIILIKADKSDQLERVRKRDACSLEYIKGIIDAQMPLEEKAKYCKYVINNNREIDFLKSEVEKLAKILLGLEG